MCYREGRALAGYSRQLRAGLLVTLGSLATLLLLLAGPVQAVEVKLYGKAHLSVDWLGDGEDAGLNVSSNSSRLGVRAEHEVQDGLTVLMQLEQNVRYDQRGGEFASRDSFLGVRGSFGLVRVGYFDTPMKHLRKRMDVFNDELADARNIVSGDTMSFDKRFRNGLHYRSPTWQELTFDVQYSPHEAVGATSENDLEALSTTLNWTPGNWHLGLGYERQEQQWGNPTAWRLGMAYQVTPELELLSMVQQAESLEFGDRLAGGLGARYERENWVLQGQYYVAGSDDRSDSGAQMLALGLERHLSSRFHVYLIGGVTNNDPLARFNISDGGRDTTLPAAVPGENVTGLSLGLIFDF